jgi:hypothetical protein
MDEGQIYLGVQVIHSKDPLYKAQPSELAPQRTNKEQMDRAFDNDVPLHASDKSKWTAEGGILAMDGSTVPMAYFNRRQMPCSGYSGPGWLQAAEVTMRECKIQVQVLGLRNMSRALGLESPSLHLFVQTTEKWDADPAGYKPTKDKSLPSPFEANLKEQLELDVLLPDDAEYAPNLEMVVIDKQGLIFKSNKIICWGTVPLKDFYPSGEKPEGGEEEEEDEEDAAAKARREKAEKKRQFESLIGTLLRQGTVTAKEAKVAAAALLLPFLPLPLLVTYRYDQGGQGRRRCLALTLIFSLFLPLFPSRCLALNLSPYPYSLLPFPLTLTRDSFRS